MAKGFSILELAIAVLILLLLASIGTAAFFRFRDAQELARAMDDAMDLVREARSRTLASELDNQFGVHFESGRAVLFQGASYAEGAAGNKAYPFSPRVEAYSITVPGSAVVFERLTGNASGAGSVSFRLKSDPSKIRAFTITVTGLLYAQ
ncbi:MAG: prepilin-type N-terminal cleavage/methylation domain-containing protein [Candidatus Niyogibacteria bacterium]|nr:prepilin-type N-terminal cleavage/methylation domain-containing protein [Candidatus Niyogibacteria bacterium]